MRNILSNGYQFILTRGVSEEYTEYDQQTSLINLMVFFSSLGALSVHAAGVYMNSHPFFLRITIFITILYGAVLVFHHFGWTELARFYICLIVPSWYFICILYAGSYFAQEAASLATVFAIYLFFKERWLLCFVLIVYNMLMYLVPTIYITLYEPLQDIPDINFDEVVVYLGSLGWIAMTFYFFEKRRMEYIESLRSKNEELNQKNEQLEEFTHVVSHDLQEPLQTISSLTAYLKKKEDPNFSTNVKQSLSYLEASSSRMRKMIKGLLDHVEIGRSSAIKEQVDLQVVVEEVLQSLNGSIDATQASVKVAPLPLVVGYEFELGLLFQNVFANALRYKKVDTAPQIIVQVKPKGKYYQFSIADNGIGIEEKYFGKIFQVFQRLHNREEYEGTGIGLAHCKRIIERHGGEIWVESEEGVGSTFFFTLEKV